MKQLLENIRQKPVHHQNRIIWAIAGGVVVILLVIWAFIGVPTKNTTGDVINQATSDYNQSQNKFPDLFPKK